MTWPTRSSIRVARSRETDVTRGSSAAQALIQQLREAPPQTQLAFMAGLGLERDQAFRAIEFINARDMRSDRAEG